LLQKHLDELLCAARSTQNKQRKKLILGLKHAEDT